MALAITAQFLLLAGLASLLLNACVGTTGSSFTDPASLTAREAVLYDRAGIIPETGLKQVKNETGITIRRISGRIFWLLHRKGESWNRY